MLDMLTNATAVIGVIKEFLSLFAEFPLNIAIVFMLAKNSFKTIRDAKKTAIA